MKDLTPRTGTVQAREDPCAHCTLADARTGERFTITSVDDERARVTALRFGMAEGARVHCVQRIPAGPIVLRSGRQEIAVGRELAKRIRIRRDRPAEPVGGSGR
jgi:Fe2+ transport system protein FeoA